MALRFRACQKHSESINQGAETADLTVSHVSQLRYELILLAVLPPRHEALIVRRVRIPVDVHQEGWGHKVWRLLRLLVQHVVVGVADKRPVVRMEKHLLWNLEEIRSA